VRALARRALARAAQARRGTARTGAAGRARGCTWTHALAGAQVVAREPDLQGAGAAAHAGNDRKESTVVVSPVAERTRNDMPGKVYLKFKITVGGTRSEFYTNARPLGEPLVRDRQLVAEFLGWFFARDLPKDRNWLAVAIAEWTRRKLACMEEEPAPIRDKYAARSHPRALVRVPGWRRAAELLALVAGVSLLSRVWCRQRLRRVWAACRHAGR